MVLFNLIYLSKGPFLPVRGGDLAAIAHSVESMKHGSAILRDHSKTGPMFIGALYTILSGSSHVALGSSSARPCC